MTSNIGSSYLLDGLMDNGEISGNCESLVMTDLRNYFRPEFLNRLDETILFKPLTKDNIGNIIELLIADLNHRLVDRNITIELTDTAKSFVMEQAYDPVYGARPLKRYLQKHIETLSARLILSDQVSEGDTIIINMENGQLNARVK
jgi:ATP-dependent Clp protease ATP-binding subunit ClpB